MHIQAEALERVVTRIFAAAGCGGDEASCVARHLVDSNLCGHDSHGVIRVLRYVHFVRDGWVRTGQHIRVVTDAGSMVVIEGNRGFGQVICEEAMTLLAERTRAHGLALAALRNVAHIGRLGDWAEQLGRDGLVSLHFINTTGLGMLALPFGGSDRRMSLNPLSICVPVEGRPPILLDMTTTVVAEGKIAVARNKGERLAPGLIVDKSGAPSTDPEDFYAGGALLPIAGHKGAGLNFMTDLLSGALSGGGCTAPGVTELESSMTSIAIDPARLTDRGAYAAEVKRYADWVTASPPREPGGKVMAPGEVEQNTRAERARDGIPLDDATWSQIVEAAATGGITAREVESLMAG